MSWGIDPWGPAPWAGASSTPALSPTTNDGVLLSIDIYAHDLIEVTFASEMRNNDFFKTVSNWALTGSLSGTIDVNTVLSGTGFLANVVYLEIEPFQVGEGLFLAVNPEFKSRTGGSMSKSTAEILARRTKVDSIVSSRPSMYNMGMGSTLRNVLTAIGRQDDLIGGDKSED